MSDSSPPPLTPGVGARRQKFPKLPLSAFSPSPTGSSTGAPAPPSPSSLHPAAIVDAHYVVGSTPDLSTSSVGTKLKGLVVVIPVTDGADKAIAELMSSSPTHPGNEPNSFFVLDSGTKLRPLQL
jgi:hypothetical protein